MKGNVPQLRMSGASKDTRLLLYLLLLELALLFFQHVISSAIRKETITLGEIYESLAGQREEYVLRSEQLKACETEETIFKQKLPGCIDGATLALTQTRETLNTLKITGEVKEKTQRNQSVVLETVCEGSYSNLTALLGSLREQKYAVRLGGLIVEAIDSGRLRFTAEIEYALHTVLQEDGSEDV